MPTPITKAISEAVESPTAALDLVEVQIVQPGGNLILFQENAVIDGPVTRDDRLLPEASHGGGVGARRRR